MFFNVMINLTPISFLQEIMATFPRFDKWIPKLVTTKIPNAVIEGPQELHANQNTTTDP